MLGKRGSVMLSLRRIPEGISRKELKAFIQNSVQQLGSRPFSLKAAVCNCSIVCISDSESGTREYHGLVEIQPAKAAMEAIQALDGKMLMGQRLEVRRYRQRTPLLDHKEGLIGFALGNGEDAERRRRNLKIDLISA